MTSGSQPVTSANRKLSLCLSLLLVSACAMAWAAETATEHPVELLMPGTFHGNEVSAEFGEKWLALVSENGSKDTRLIEVSLKVKAVPDMDDKEGEATGKEVSVEPPQNVRFFVRGDKRFKAGTVETFVLDGEELSPEKAFVFRSSDGTEYKLSFQCPEPVQFDDHGFGTCMLILEGAGETQELKAVSLWRSPEGKLLVASDAALRVIWAGDIDGDGKLDLLVDLTNHYNVSAPTLFLSTAATKGDLVGRVASFVSYGC
jgi:hypothetical protein